MFPRSHSRLVFNFNVLLLGNELDKASWLHKVMGAPGRLKASPIAVGKNIPIDTGNVELETKQCNYGFHLANASNDPRYQAILKRLYMRNKDAYFIFYACSDRRSFDVISTYVNDVREVNPSAHILLIDVVDGQPPEVSQQEIAQLSGRLKISFACKVDLADNNELLVPLNFVVSHIQTKIINVPLDLSACIRMVKEARRYCWDSSRIMLLDHLTAKLTRFSELASQASKNKFAAMDQQCRELLRQVDAILASTQPESIKMAVYFAGATALLITAAVCGILLMSVSMLPILASILVAGCVIAATSGAGLIGFGIYKVKENSIYLAIESSTKAALAAFLT